MIKWRKNGYIAVSVTLQYGNQHCRPCGSVMMKKVAWPRCTTHSMPSAPVRGVPAQSMAMWDKRVAILARNSYQYVICMYGTVIAGAVAVPLNLARTGMPSPMSWASLEPVCIPAGWRVRERGLLLAETYGSILKPMDVFLRPMSLRGRDRGAGPQCDGLYHVHLRHHWPQQGRYAVPEEPVHRHACLPTPLTM